ncbi:hypothetical protein MBUL_03793 [Methylobacterium bullatum]|uniref:Uncharacterized protein n=1 Tax=Methylobacterium bullatum TaxID=570505 RepID=A0A679J6C2_9HYPH|nr:hypothetical protein MBUL_03793 [Methylobacterium bullatum]
MGDVTMGWIVRAAAMAAVGVGVLGLGACGSITRGTSEKMAFQTEPPAP